MEPRKTTEKYLVDHMVSHLTCPYFIKDEAQLREFCAGAGFCPTTREFVVILIRFEQWSLLFSDEDTQLEAAKHNLFILTNMMEDILSKKSISAVAERDFQLACIVNLQQPWAEFRQELQPALNQMLEVLETEFSISVTISVSAPVTGLSAISTAYGWASDALWYNEYLGQERQLLFYDDLTDETQPQIRSELTELDKKLIVKLQNMDIAGVKYALHEMIDREFIQTVPTIRILRIRIGGISCKILDALDEFRAFTGDSLYYQLCPGPRIAGAMTLTELTTAMDEIFDAIEAHQHAIQQEPKPQWVDKMAIYISEHYSDENMGLTEVSAAFGITPSYATRVFKQYTGRGIYETIQHARLTAAKALLHTDKTMKQIAEMVGYTSFLSMNRAFKKYEGTTPTQFKAH